MESTEPPNVQYVNSNVSPIIGRNQRKFPIPKQVNYYILENYARAFYSGKPEERHSILHEISSNIRKYGYDIASDELERRFKNMKAHYRRKKDDLESGIIKIIEWEYYPILDEIFKNTKIKRNITRARFHQNTTENAIDLSSQAQVPSTQQQQRTINKSINRQPEQEQIVVKMESQDNPELIIMHDKKVEVSDEPLKRNKAKVIEFNNINDITCQLPSITSKAPVVNNKEGAIKRISEELRKLDKERIQLDEQRLQLEIKRNDIDKAAYTLTELLNEIIK